MLELKRTLPIKHKKSETTVRGLELICKQVKKRTAKIKSLFKS